MSEENIAALIVAGFLVVLVFIFMLPDIIEASKDRDED